MTKPAKIGLLIAAVTLAAGVRNSWVRERERPPEDDDRLPPEVQPVHGHPCRQHPEWRLRPRREIVSWDDLYKGGKKAGRDANACVITNLTPLQAECTITFVTADGTITAQYMGTPPPHKIAAVTGGTGKYLGARGQVVLVESGSDTNVKGNTATFTLLG